MNAVVSSRNFLAIRNSNGIVEILTIATKPAATIGLREISRGIPRIQMNNGKFFIPILEVMPVGGNSPVSTMFMANISAEDSSSLNSIRSRLHTRRYPPTITIMRRETIFFLFMREIGDINDSF
jgi:hypothetical protein